MSNRLAGKIAMVTGSAKGIGRAITELFLKEGAILIATDKDFPMLQSAYEDFKEISSDRIEIIQMDTTNKKEVENTLNQIINKHHRIDILINNAGMNVFDDPLTLSDEQWEKCFDINLKGAWNCSKAVLPHFIHQAYGNVVNIASVHGHSIIKGCFPYPVAKHGVLGLTKALGIEYAAMNIRFNSISPGLIMTPAIENYLAQQPDPELELEKQRSLLPCKRIGTAEEVAYTALFLASDEARYINATDIKIDGGRTAVYHD